MGSQGALAISEGEPACSLYQVPEGKVSTGVTVRERAVTTSQMLSS